MLVGDSDSTCASPGAFAKSKSVKREVDHPTPTTIDQYYHWTVGMFPCSRFGVQYLHWFDRLRGVGCKSSGARGPKGNSSVSTLSLTIPRRRGGGKGANEPELRDVVI